MSDVRYWPRTGRGYTIPMTGLPPQAGAPMVLACFHFSWWTFGLALCVCVVFAYAAFKNRTLGWAIKRFRSMMRAGTLSARPRYYRNRFIYDVPAGDLDFDDPLKEPELDGADERDDKGTPGKGPGPTRKADDASRRQDLRTA